LKIVGLKQIPTTKQNMSKNTVKADINFEQELWKAANELRGAVAESIQRLYVPLIFLKHMSERYELEKGIAGTYSR
jgi:type I restriction-modification system DNA methylase subunit